MTIGVERDPGETTTSRSPWAIHSSNRVEHMVTAKEEGLVIASIVAFVRVEIFQDLVCPWCYIGKQRFDAAVKAHLAERPDARIEIDYRPFQLDPRAPLDSARPVVDAYAAKFGGAERAEAIIEHVTTAARSAGLPIRMDLAKRANTRLAHRLLLVADGLPADRRSAVSEKLVELLYRTYFVDGGNLGDRSTLKRVGLESGLTSTEIDSVLRGDAADAEIDAHLAHASEVGVSAVPTFVFDGKWIVSGAQETSFFLRAFTRLMSDES
jgi:predicted DsbA family dithiol-disulfide isomerase